MGVSTDELVLSYKKKTPIIPFEERVRIVEAIRYVDRVVPQTNRDKKQALMKYKFDVMFVGSDWRGTPMWVSLEEEFSSLGVEIVYFPYTQGTSSTLLASVLHRIYSDEAAISLDRGE